MIERQVGKVAQGKPRRVARVGPGINVVPEQVRQCVVGNRYDAFARVAVHITERVELFQKYTSDARFLFELSACCRFQRLIDPYEPAGNSPHASVGLNATLNEHDLEVILIDPEDDAVDGQSWAGELVGVGHGGLSCIRHT